MFEQTFVEGVGKTKPWTVLVSFLGQMLVIAIAILIPMIYFDALPKSTLSSFLVAPPPPPPPPPPPAAAPKIVKVIPRQFDAGRLMSPKAVPKEIAMIKEEELPPPSSGGVVGGVTGVLGIDQRPRFHSYVVERHHPSYQYGEDVRIGAVLPDDGVTMYDVPQTFGVTPYRYTVVNGRTVLVEPRSRRIVQVIE